MKSNILFWIYVIENKNIKLLSLFILMIISFFLIDLYKAHVFLLTLFYLWSRFYLTTMEYFGIECFSYWKFLFFLGRLLRLTKKSRSNPNKLFHLLSFRSLPLFFTLTVKAIDACRSKSSSLVGQIRKIEEEIVSFWLIVPKTLHPNRLLMLIAFMTGW